MAEYQCTQLNIIKATENTSECMLTNVKQKGFQQLKIHTVTALSKIWQ